MSYCRRHFISTIPSRKLISRNVKRLNRKMSMKKIIYSTVLLALSQNVFAQRDSLQSSQLNEVVVTATKYPKKSSETGKVVTVIAREQLDRSEGKDLAQLLNEQAGISVNGANSNPAKDKSIYLRGA